MATSCIFLASIVLLRLRYILVERRRKAVQERCRLALVSAAAGEHVGLPFLDSAEVELLLPQWSQMRDAVRGESAESLESFGRRIGLDRIATKLLASGNARPRLLAINTLGYLGTEASRPVLESYCHDKSNVVSLAAARSLLRLDEAWAIPRLVPLMLQREDWSLSRLVPLLRDADLTLLEIELAKVVESMGGVAPERLLLIAIALPHDRTSPWVRTTLERSAGEAQIAAALRLVTDPRDVSLVRPFLWHSSWQVRVRAVTAMERLAGIEDVPCLISALADPEWWVRQRAARTLARLAWLSDDELEHLCNGISDRYASDALRQMIAEERVR